MNKLLRNLTIAFALVIAIAAPLVHADTTTEPTSANPVEQCGDAQVEIKSFGAGLMYQPRPIAIAGEHLSVVNISEGCAVVSWVTDIPATSQVVFTEIGETVDMDATKKNLGFSKATAQNNSAYVVHNAILKDLTPGKTYIYRVVSRSHPSAVPSVGEAQIFVVPKEPVLPGPISVAPIVQAPIIAPVVVENTTSSVPSTIEKVITITTTDLLYQDAGTGETATTTAATSSELSNVPAAITAAANIGDMDESTGTSFWSRLKQAFSFFGGGNVATEVVKTESQLATPAEQVANDEDVVIDASGLVARAGFLIPTLFILLFIFLIQQIALPMIGIIVERPLVFWMFSVIVVAIASGLLKYYKITLVMIAVFLALLAWYLLSEAEGEINEKVEKPKEDRESQQKTLVKTT